MLRNILRGSLIKQGHHAELLGCFRGLSTKVESSNQKVYELRTYDLVPQKVGEFMKLSNEKFHLRTQHSVLLGYWTTELGGLNQVVHLWEYGSLSERSGVRAKLGGDPEWQAEYFQKILPWLQHQDNITLSRFGNELTDKTDLTLPSTGGYELWQLNMKTLPQEWVPDVIQAVHNLNNTNREICGLYKSEIGDMNSVVMIWKHQNIDQINSLKEDLFSTDAGKKLWANVSSGRSKFMMPAKFSNWK